MANGRVYHITETKDEIAHGVFVKTYHLTDQYRHWHGDYATWDGAVNAKNRNNDAEIIANARRRDLLRYNDYDC